MLVIRYVRICRRLAAQHHNLKPEKWKLIRDVGHDSNNFDARRSLNPRFPSSCSWSRYRLFITVHWVRQEPLHHPNGEPSDCETNHIWVWRFLSQKEEEYSRSICQLLTEHTICLTLLPINPIYEAIQIHSISNSWSFRSIIFWKYRSLSHDKIYLYSLLPFLLFDFVLFVISCFVFQLPPNL